MGHYIINAIIIAIAWCIIAKKNAQIRELNEKAAQAEKQKEELERIMEEYNKLKEFKKQYDEGAGKLLQSNLTAIPWLSAMMADYLTFDMEMEAMRASALIPSPERTLKVNTIREIRRDAEERIAQAKAAIYQLEYIKKLYPQLEEIIGTDYNDLDFSSKMPEIDVPRQLLTKEEWDSLDEKGRNQLALDKYYVLRKSNKWQAGCDYISSVAYKFAQNGWSTETESLPFGIDIIAHLDGNTIVAQCKYCADDKPVHENYIASLNNARVAYCIENKIKPADIMAVFVTNGRLSEKAREMADVMGVKLIENHEYTEFPRIKCVIDINEKKCGYHLPFDYWYDDVKLENEGEFYAFTVAEAEEKGFRRAYKWHGLPQ